MAELVVILQDREVGRVSRDRHGRSVFTYADDWRRAPQAYPLSLSMPLAQREHDHRRVEPYLWGLLPDNELILQRWAQRFRVSARSAIGLLTHVGNDCAGAVRFVHPSAEREMTREGEGEVVWLDEAKVAARLRQLATDESAWRTAEDAGHFSLAGAQPKTALLRRRKRWGLPSGRIATTHILKPGISDLQDSAQNEHFCLRLAGSLGLTTAHSWVERFEDQVVIVVERYDRLHADRGVERIHQEDACQALAVHPDRKYQNEGGPGPADIVDLLRQRAPHEDANSFVDALIYNWLIAGTDAHAKNYSFLIGSGGKARLAPLYDVASALPYESIDLRKAKLAMKIGGTYRLREVGRPQWDKLALDIGSDADLVRARALAMAGAAPDEATSLLAKLGGEGLRSKVLDRLASAIAERARDCAALLD